MRKLGCVVFICLILSNPVRAELMDEAAAAFDIAGVEEALPEEAEAYMEGISAEPGQDFGEGLGQIISGAISHSESALKTALAVCLQIMAVVLLSSLLRGFADGNNACALELSGVLAVGMCCLGRFSGYFGRVAETVDSMSAFSGFLFSALAATSAATGAVGTSGALYAATTAVCGAMSRVLQSVFLPAVSSYIVLMLAHHALGDGGLSAAADMVKQLVTMGLKLSVIGFTAYMSLTGVVSGSADSAAVKAAKLTISSAVPVVGSMIADASETLLVSAGLIRSGLGIFGMLGVLAVSIGPFLETGLGYLSMKCTAALAASVGEKQLSSLISALAGAMGLITALTGVCTVLILISCVAFMGFVTGG